MAISVTTISVTAGCPSVTSDRWLPDNIDKDANSMRKFLDLETASKEEAATKARDLYLSIVAKGWSATLEELAPQPTPPVNVTEGNPTMGSFWRKSSEPQRSSPRRPVTTPSTSE